jgi:hypothetical protein
MCANTNQFDAVASHMIGFESHMRAQYRKVAKVKIPDDHLVWKRLNWTWTRDDPTPDIQEQEEDFLDEEEGDDDNSGGDEDDGEDGDFDEEEEETSDDDSDTLSMDDDCN